MIITLKGADFSAKNIGQLTTWSVFTTLGVGATYNGTKMVDRNAALNATVTIASGYELGSAGVTVTMGGTTLSGAATVSGNTITIAIASVTGAVYITVPTVNTSTGEEDSGGSSDSGNTPDASGFTLQTLSLDETSWALSTIGTGGVSGITDGSSTKRLSCKTSFDTPTSQQVKMILNDGYNWAIRSGASDSSMAYNQYWYKSGDVVQIPLSNTKFGIILRKATGWNDDIVVGANSTGEQTMSKSDIELANPKLYINTGDRVEMDYSAYTLIEELDGTDTSKWALATVAASGVGSDGSRNDRLSYTTVYDIPATPLVKVDCADGWQWALRSGSSATNLSSNQYWFNPGTDLWIGNGNITTGKMMLVFRKVTNTVAISADTYCVTDLSKSNVAEINAKLYTV